MSTELLIALGAAAYFAVGQDDARDGSLYSHRVAAVTFSLRIAVLATLVYALAQDKPLSLNQLIPLFSVMVLIALRSFWSRVGYDPNQNPWEGSASLRLFSMWSSVPVVAGLALYAMLVPVPVLEFGLSTNQIAIYTALTLGLVILLAQGVAQLRVFDSGAFSSARSKLIQREVLKAPTRSRLAGNWILLTVRPRGEGEVTTFEAPIWKFDGEYFWPNEQLRLLARYFNWIGNEIKLPNSAIHDHVATFHSRPGHRKLHFVQFVEANPTIGPLTARMRRIRGRVLSVSSSASLEPTDVENAVLMNRVDPEFLERFGLECIDPTAIRITEGDEVPSARSRCRPLRAVIAWISELLR